MKLWDKFSESFDDIFGAQDYEKILHKSENKDIKKMLNTISFIRLLVFPICLPLFLLYLILSLNIIVSDIISSISKKVFELLNDSLWIDLRWFNLDTTQLDQEIERIQGLNEGD